MKHIRGSLKIPIILCWTLFIFHFIYLLILFILKKYISLLYLITDIEILLNLEFTALFITLSNHKNNYTFYIISFVLSIIDVLFILFGIFIIIFSFIEKEALYNFIKPEPWIEKEGKSWIGGLLIFEKIVDLFPLVVLIIYFRKLKKSLGSIDPRSLSVNDDAIIADVDADNDKLI